MAHLGVAKSERRSSTRTRGGLGDACGAEEETRGMHSRASPSPGRAGHVNGLRSCLLAHTFADEKKVQAGGVLHDRIGQAGLGRARV